MIKKQQLPRIVVAKFTPDVFRNEPRNIGLILWVEGQFFCKFLDSPPFVPKDQDYERWISYWEDSVKGESIYPLRGKPVPVHDRECVDALFTTDTETFSLVEAGEIIDRVNLKNAPKALNSLFSELVAVREQSQKEHAVTLERSSDKLIIKSGLKSVAGFRRKFDFTGSAYGVQKHMRFHYAIANDNQPSMVIQRVNIDTDSSVHDTAFKANALVNEARLIPRNRCLALIQSSSVASSKNGAKENLEVLKRLCNVVDVDDTKAAREQLAELAMSVQSMN